jgi:hypothetical protein
MEAGARWNEDTSRHEIFQIKYQCRALLDVHPFWGFPMARDDCSTTGDMLMYNTYFGEVVHAKQSMRIRVKSPGGFTSSCLTLARKKMNMWMTGVKSSTWWGSTSTMKAGKIT